MKGEEYNRTNFNDAPGQQNPAPDAESCSSYNQPDAQIEENKSNLSVNFIRPARVFPVAG